MSRKTRTLSSGGRLVATQPYCYHDTDIDVFQENGHLYPTLARIALDVLPAQASSVPCERLFSAGKEIATACRSQLGSERFEELQMMKFAWQDSIADMAAWNSAQVEEVDLEEYVDMLRADVQLAAWDIPEDEVCS